METQTVTVNADEFKQLALNVEMIKSFLISRKSDPEGELSDWAKKELEEARNTPIEEFISLEEVEKEFL